MSDRDTEIQGNAELTDIGASAEVAEGEMRAFLVAAMPTKVAVYRVEGKLFATDDRCSHAVASLSEGWLEGHHVVCPAHSGEFDIRDGQPKCFPAAKPIRTFGVHEIDGRILIDTSTGAGATS